MQKTGWGKSAVYFIAAKLLREQGAELALLVSPLIYLMRNQILPQPKGWASARPPSGWKNRLSGQAIEAAFRANQVDILVSSQHPNARP